MITLGLGEYAITDAINETLITYALGSCIALIIHCPTTKCTAMAHIVLPKYEEHQAGIHKEGYFVNDITPKLVHFFKKKKTCDLKKLKVIVVGGSDSTKKNDLFNIGKRNIQEVKRILDSYHIKYDISETSGCYTRSVSLSVKDGVVNIKKQDMIL